MRLAEPDWMRILKGRHSDQRLPLPLHCAREPQPRPGSSTDDRSLSAPPPTTGCSGIRTWMRVQQRAAEAVGAEWSVLVFASKFGLTKQHKRAVNRWSAKTSLEISGFFFFVPFLFFLCSSLVEGVANGDPSVDALITCQMSSSCAGHAAQQARQRLASASAVCCCSANSVAHSPAFA